MKDDFASGNPKGPKTSNLNPDRSTGSLEQLPPTKKRDLRTGSLSPAQTHPSLDVVPQPQPEPPKPEPAAKPAPAVPPPQPVPQPVPPPQPVLPVARTVEPEAKPPLNILSGERTSEIEMGRLTTNHQVIKDPIPSPAPVKPAQPEPPPEAPAPRPQQVLVESVEQHTAQTEAIFQQHIAMVEAAPPSFSVPDYSKANEPSSSSSAGEVQLFGSFGYLDSASSNEPQRSIVRRIFTAAIPVILLLATAAAILIFVPNLRQRYVPVRVASILGFKTETIPMVSVQEYRIGLDEKENSATISGVVKNLSEETVGPLQVEVILSKREDVRASDVKLIPIDPGQLGPNQEGKYELKISAKDYQQTKIARILSGETSLRVKKLKEIIDPKPQIDPTQLPASQASTSEAPKPDPNHVYDGSVSFK